MRRLVVLLISIVTGTALLPATTANGAGAPGFSRPSVPDDVIAASSAPGSGWRPESASYGVGSRKDIPVTMADGTVLRVDVYYPTDPVTGQQAGGDFPTVLTQTPYGKGTLALGGDIAAQTGPANYLVRRGYLDVVADVRGTGDSQGQFGLFDPPQVRDGVRLVNWSARLPHSDGKVGLYGASYLGINQLLTAGAVGKHSPLKAIFPVVAGNDLYRDTTTMGGLIDVEFDAAYLALTGGLNLANPLLDALRNPGHAFGDLNPVMLQHLADVLGFDVPFAANALRGGDKAYDGAYWQARAPQNVLGKVAAKGIPAYLVGGEYDLFQRGEPLNYAALQNAWAGRPTTAPMRQGQSVTGRYQLLVGPWTHLQASIADLDKIELEWFDTWLKGERTGMAHTPTPLHYYDLGTKSYAETTSYPIADATPTRYYFTGGRSGSAPASSNDGGLATTPPATTGGDTMVWAPVGSPCGRPSDQWSAGAPSLLTGSLGAPNAPCVQGDDRLNHLGPQSLTYTTDPLASAKTLAGPIDATIYATASSKDTEWVVQVEDVAPDGTSTPLTEGALLGSLRAVNHDRSWYSPDGQLIMPYHPYTKRSQRDVVPGKVTRYDVEVFPSYATIAKGHRIRVTLSSADTPHLLPTVPALAKLAGGVYQVQHGPDAASAIELPLK